MAAGREIWGWPKKFADLRVDFGGAGKGYREQFMYTVERPAGKREDRCASDGQAPHGAE